MEPDSTAEAPDRAPGWMAPVAAVLAAWPALWIGCGVLYLTGALALQAALGASPSPTSGPMLGLAVAALAGGIGAAWVTAKLVRRRFGRISRWAAIVWLTLLAAVAYLGTPTSFVYTVLD